MARNYPKRKTSKVPATPRSKSKPSLAQKAKQISDETKSALKATEKASKSSKSRSADAGKAFLAKRQKSRVAKRIEESMVARKGSGFAAFSKKTGSAAKTASIPSKPKSKSKSKSSRKGLSDGVGKSFLAKKQKQRVGKTISQSKKARSGSGFRKWSEKMVKRDEKGRFANKSNN